MHIPPMHSPSEPRMASIFNFVAYTFGPFAMAHPMFSVPFLMFLAYSAYNLFDDVCGAYPDSPEFEEALARFQELRATWEAMHTTMRLKL